MPQSFASLIASTNSLWSLLPPWAGQGNHRIWRSKCTFHFSLLFYFILIFHIFHVLLHCCGLICNYLFCFGDSGRYMDKKLQSKSDSLFVASLICIWTCSCFFLYKKNPLVFSSWSVGVVLLGPGNILKLQFSLSLYFYFRVEFSVVKQFWFYLMEIVECLLK